MTVKRKHNREIEDRVMHLANYECCICKKRGDQIHHLNGRSSDTFEDNLVALCLPHHADASEKNPMRRTFKPGAIRLTRDDHYKSIAQWRESFVPKMDGRTRDLVVIGNIQTVIIALALLEIERVEYDYLYGRHSEREEVLGRLRPFSKFNDIHIGHAILEFVQSAAHHTRNGLSADDCAALIHLAIHYYPRSKMKGAKAVQERFAILALSAASAMVYDAAIHVMSLHTALHGLTLFKFVHQQAGRYNSNTIALHVKEALSALLSQVIRPDNDDQDMFTVLVKEFQKNMDDGDLSFPIFSQEVMGAMRREVQATAN